MKISSIIFMKSQRNKRQIVTQEGAATPLTPLLDPPLMKLHVSETLVFHLLISLLIKNLLDINITGAEDGQLLLIK